MSQDFNPSGNVESLREQLGEESDLLLEGPALARDYLEAFAKEQEAKDEQGPHRELQVDVETGDLAQTGWGVIFPPDQANVLSHQLEPLLEKRRCEAGELYQEPDYRSPELARHFLWRHGAAPGTLDTTRMPYYLLIVGGPEAIPFDFQYQLAINHAVGRVAFDRIEDYGLWAEKVAQVESEGLELERKATVFAVDNGDVVGRLLDQYLVRPLEETIQGIPVEVWRNERATKEAFARLAGGDATPALLLAACHGKSFPLGDPQQEKLQGALVCQRPEGTTCPPFFHGGDVVEDACLLGQIAFLFACYGAGTPLDDNFPDESPAEGTAQAMRRHALALRPFVASLPQTLLVNGAQAVLGHIDRGWTLSFSWHHQGENYDGALSLIDSLRRLVLGQRLGHALRPFYRRYTALAAQLLGPLEMLRFGERVDEKALGLLWTAHNDARNFIVLGDPAVQLMGSSLKGE